MLTFEADSQVQAAEWIHAQNMAIEADPGNTARHHVRQRLQATMISDAPGFDLCPDPLGAGTVGELMDALRQFRIWAGEPSLREIARASGQAIGVSTLSTILRGSELPTLRLLLTIVSACGGSDGHQRAFATAWRRLRMTGRPLPHHAGACDRPRA